MIQGLLEFVREQQMHQQCFTRPQLATALPPPPASPSITFHSPLGQPRRGGLSISCSTASAAAPHRTLCSRSVPLHKAQVCGP